MKQRIVEYINYKRISQGKFEKLCGLSNGTINNIKANLSSVGLQKVLEACPDINTQWLISGEGEMLNRPAIISTSHITDSDVNIAGTSLNVTKTDNDLSRLTDVIERQSKQIDRLLSIIEKMQN